MKSKEEIKQWLLKNAVNEYGDVDLSDINFGELMVYFSGVKAHYINNNFQEAHYINNNYQKATNHIDNSSQRANNIYNYYQKATNHIDNSSQEATTLYNYSQEAKNINNRYQEAKNIYNYSQRANNIYNYYQKATNYFNTHNAVIDGVQYEVDVTDDVYTIIYKKRAYNGITFIKGETLSGGIVYLYKNNLVSYHERTQQKAKDGFKRKLDGFTVKQEIIDEIKSTQRITREQYHELTGACNLGIQAFAERIGMADRDYLTLEELSKLLTPNDYGYNYIKQWGVIE